MPSEFGQPRTALSSVLPQDLTAWKTYLPRKTIIFRIVIGMHPPPSVVWRKKNLRIKPLSLCYFIMHTATGRSLTSGLLSQAPTQWATSCTLSVHRQSHQIPACVLRVKPSLLPSFVNAAVLAVILATIVFPETTRNMENKTCFRITLYPNCLYLYDFCQNFNWLYSNLRTGSLCLYTYPTLLSFLRAIMEKTDHWISTE